MKSENEVTKTYQYGKEWNGITPVNLIDESGNVIMSIPQEPENYDYKQYLLWVENGGVTLPADE